MSGRFKSIADIGEINQSQRPPTPQADPDQLICVNTTNLSSKNTEDIDKYASMRKNIDPAIVPCVPIYGLFTQTQSQIYNVESLFTMFSEYEDKMPVETSITTETGTETTTSSAVELVNEGSNAICNFTLIFDPSGIPVVNFQYVDKDLTKYNTPFTKYMIEATKSREFLRAIGLLIIENVFLYGLDGITKQSGGCQGTFFMYYNRPLGGEGFHKDSIGNSSFVCLNYLNKSVLPSAIMVLSNTPVITGELDKVDDILELIIREIDIPHCTEAQIAKTYDMGPYGTIGFNDLVIAHSSPFDKTDTSVKEIHPIVTSPGIYGQSVPSPLPSYISSSPHPRIKEYTDVSIPRNFTRMWFNFKDPSVAGAHAIGFPYETISLNELNNIIFRCRQRRMNAQKCLSMEELCTSFIDPIHNPGSGKCFTSLSRSNSPAYHPQGIPYRPPSTTTTPSALEMGMQPSPLFRPLAAPAPIGSSLTTTSTSLFRPVATAPAATAPALAPAAQPGDLYPELPDYDPDHPDNRGGSNKKNKKNT